MQDSHKATTINHFYEKLLKIKVRPEGAQQGCCSLLLGSDLHSWSLLLLWLTNCRWIFACVTAAVPRSAWPSPCMKLFL